MRRALAAAVVTVAGLIALLDYRSGSPASANASRDDTSASSATSTTVAPTTTTSSGSGRSSSSDTTSGGSASTTATASSETATGQEVTYQYGDIEVRVTVADGKITSVTVPQNDAADFRSEQINTQAVPQLTAEVISAQGTSIDAVSGATYTSDAFIQSLTSALSKVGK